MARISKFGILELSRQKKQSTIQEISYTKCPYCKGSGLRPSLECAALGAFRRIESEAVKGFYAEMQIILPHEIADYILNRKRNELLKLESAFDLHLNIYGSMEIAWDKMEIRPVLREQTKDAHESQDVPAQGHMTVTVENKCAMEGEAHPKKKSRRRPRHRKKKPAESAAEASPSGEATSGIEPSISPGAGTPILKEEKPGKISFTIEPAKPGDVFPDAKLDDLDDLFFLSEDL